MTEKIIPRDFRRNLIPTDFRGMREIKIKKNIIIEIKIAKLKYILKYKNFYILLKLNINLIVFIVKIFSKT